MEKTFSVDIGNNITALLEKLATQIGVTAEQIFPWYAKQSVIEGYMFFVVAIPLFISGVIISSLFWKKADWKNGNEYLVITVVAVAITAISGMALAGESVESVSKILNPEYHAMSSLMADLGRLSK